MKAFIKTICSCALALTMLISLVSCSLFGGDDDGDFAADYQNQEITPETASSIRSTLESKALENSSYLKYAVTYRYDLESTRKGYEYNNKYDINMQVNGEAAVGEVFAYIELKSVYTQPDGESSRDVLVKLCVVRTGAGENYSDYKVFVNIDDKTYGATFDEMLEAIREADRHSVSGADDVMKYALDYEKGYGNYFEVITAYADAVAGREIVSASDYPLFNCLHKFNKDDFLDTLSELTESSAKRGYKLYTDGENKVKLTRKYDDKKNMEEYDEAYWLWINDDGTYSYHSKKMYKTDNPGRARIANTEQVLTPITGTITLPAWAQ